MSILGAIGAGAALAGAGAQVWDAFTGWNVAHGNLSLQKANLEWLKQMQAETWRREDNAVQRRVNDLRAAGLSPVLAAGSAASTSSPIKTEAPQLEPLWHGRAAKAAEMARNAVSDYLATRGAVNSLSLQEEQIAKTRAERDYIALQALNTEARTAMELESLKHMPFRLKLLQRDIDFRGVDTEYKRQLLSNAALDEMIRRYDLEESRKQGLRYKDSATLWPTMTGIGRRAYDVWMDLHDRTQDAQDIGGEIVRRYGDSALRLLEMISPHYRVWRGAREYFNNLNRRR